MPQQESTKSSVNFGELFAKIHESLQSSEAEAKEALNDPFKQTELEEWKQDIGLKKRYANWFIGILIGQLLIMNLVFILTGAKVLTWEDPWYLRVYMGGTLAEVFGVVLVITRSLFSKRNNIS